MYRGKPKKLYLIELSKPLSGIPQTKIHPDIEGSQCWVTNSIILARSVYKGIKPKLKSRDCVCHKCDNIYGYCCNPDHLFIGSDMDNKQDSIRKGRSRNDAYKAAQTRKKNGINSAIAAASTMINNGTYKISAKKISDYYKNNPDKAKERAAKVAANRKKNGTYKTGAEKMKKFYKDNPDLASERAYKTAATKKLRREGMENK